MRVWEGDDPNRSLELLCDFCGQEIKPCECPDKALVAGRHYNFIRLVHIWCNGSEKAGEMVDLDICQTCIYEKLLPLTTIEKDALK